MPKTHASCKALHAYTLSFSLSFLIPGCRQQNMAHVLTPTPLRMFPLPENGIRIRVRPGLEEKLHEVRALEAHRPSQWAQAVEVTGIGGGPRLEKRPGCANAIVINGHLKALLPRQHPRRAAPGVQALGVSSALQENAEERRPVNVRGLEQGAGPRRPASLPVEGPTPARGQSTSCATMCGAKTHPRVACR